MEKVRYAEMLPHEIVARRKKFPAAFIGLGGLEWHGEHLAVGNDALKAEKLCELAAGRSGGFAFPTLWYGEPRERHLLETDYDEDGRVAKAMKFKKRKFSGAYFGKTPENMTRLCAEIPSPAMKIIYDTGNPVGHGGEVWDWYTACKPHTVYVHIKDGVPGAEGEGRYTYPGEGAGMVREVMADLLASGYDGGLSIEPHMAAQVHLGTQAEGEGAFDIYVEYGRRLVKLIEDVKAK